MSLIKFQNKVIDSTKFLEEVSIGHLKSDSEVYTSFQPFSDNLFINYLGEFFDIVGDFPHVDKMTSFKKMLDGAVDTYVEVEFNDILDDDYREEKINCKQIEFDFEVTPCYIQIINLSIEKYETVKQYLTTYDWRFDIVGLFKYKNQYYIYLMCDEEN